MKKIIYFLIIIISLDVFSQVSCENCDFNQELFANHLVRNKSIDLSNFESVDVNFYFKYEYNTSTLFKIKVNNRRYYTPFTFIAEHGFKLKDDQYDNFIHKVDFNLKSNYCALLNTTEKSYDKPQSIPIKLEPMLPEYFANALFISSLLDFQDSVVEHFMKKGYLDRKYTNTDVGKITPESPYNSIIQEGREFNFEFSNLPLKDSTILEMYFRNLHDYYQRQLYSIDKNLNQHVQGFADIVLLLDSFQYEHYPSCINRSNESIYTLFLKLQQYYVPASKINSLKNCLLSENFRLSKTAFEMGNNIIFEQTIEGKILDTIIFPDRKVLYLSTDLQSFLIHIPDDSTGNMIQTNKINYCPSRLSNLFVVPVGQDILLVDQLQEFKVLRKFENSSRGTFLVNSNYFRGQQPDFLIVDNKNGSYLYNCDGWQLNDSIFDKIASLSWMRSYSNNHVALYKNNDGENVVYEADSEGVKKYKINKNVEHLIQNYFLTYNSRTRKQGLIQIKKGKIKKILPKKFDKIEFDETYLNRTPEPVLYFYGFKKGRKIKYYNYGKKY